jgi:outer membrane protein assembly factor BamD
LISLISFILILSCSSAPVIKGAESDAEAVYRQGLYYLEKKDYTSAEQKFMKVISDFSFSVYEPLATVALGDTYFMKEEYPSAVEVYSRFVKMRPSHEKTAWAELQIANSYLEQMPSDFFIFPNPSERDVEIVEKAVVQFRHYLKKYPDDSNREKGIKDLERAELILIERDLRVAEYYAKKKKCPSVGTRIKYINDHFTVTTEKNRKRIAALLKKCPAENVPQEKKKDNDKN